MFFGTNLFSQTLVWKDSSSNGGGTASTLPIFTVISGNEIFVVKEKRTPSSNLLIRKISQNGAFIYEKTPFIDNIVSYNQAVSDNNGNILVTGYISNSFSGGSGGFLLKISNDGNFVWKKMSQYSNYDILADTSGYYVLAYNQNPALCIVYKYDFNGVILWEKYFPQSNDICDAKISFDKAGKILIGITVKNTGLYIAKMEKSGFETWNLLVPSNVSYKNKIANITFDNQNNLFIECSTLLNTESICSIVKISSNGNLLNNVTTNFFNGENEEILGGNVNQTGNPFIFVRNYDSTSATKKLLLALYDNNCNLLWFKNIDSSNLYANIVKNNSICSNNINDICISYSKTAVSGNDTSIIKTFNSNGVLINSITLNKRIPASVLYNNSGNLIATFYYNPNGSVWDTFIYNYNLNTGITQIGSSIPEKFSLLQNYPNPFNPVTNIRFTIQKTDFVKLRIFNSLGKEVQQLANQNLNAGEYEISFDASGLTSGVYFYRLETENFTDTKRMILLK